MLRYYGLAAARQEEDADRLKAADLLRGITQMPRSRGPRMSPASDAEFILGFAARLSERWDEAIRHFRASLRLLEEERKLEGQRLPPASLQSAFFTRNLLIMLRPDFMRSMHISLATTSCRSTYPSRYSFNPAGTTPHYQMLKK